MCFNEEELLWGPVVEIGVVDTFSIQNSEFFFTEALWQVTCPKLNRADINFVNNNNEGRKKESWSSIREFFIHQACKYQTSVKLWDAQKPTQALHQKLPMFIKQNMLTSLNQRLKLNVPDDEGLARGQLKHLLIDCDNATYAARTAGSTVLNSRDFSKLAKNLNRILKICKYILPNRAFSDDKIDNNLRY